MSRFPPKLIGSLGFSTLLAAGWIAGLLMARPAPSATPSPSGDLAGQYSDRIRPLLRKYCLDCHSADKKEGELDLARFASAADVRADLAPWRKVIEMLEDAQMPPEDEPQPSAAEKEQLAGWARQFVDAEIRAAAGDPGRVIVRRLSNAEYNNTIRDLTGVDLQPTRQFPADGAAGEGFTNSGDALVMSPTLLGKYLAAAKEITSHAVLLPESFRFSPAVTRRDWTNEVLAELERTYRQYYGGPHDGMLEFRPYLTATIRHRQALLAGTTTTAEVAVPEGLNAKYLAAVWQALTATEPYIPLDGIRAAWRKADPEHPSEEAETLAVQIRAWQSELWKFNKIGSYMSPVWQEAVAPTFVESYTTKAQPPQGQPTATVYLVARSLAGPAGANEQGALAVWHNPRIEGGGKPPLALQDIPEGLQITQRQFAPPGARRPGTAPPAAETIGLGVHPQGKPIPAEDLVVPVGSVVEIQFPAALVQDREFVAEGKLESAQGQAIVRFEVLAAPPDPNVVPAIGLPCVASQDVRAMKPEALAAQLDTFRSVLPIYLYHGKIVPDDEIICLRMYFREDEQFERLFLEGAQRQRLDELWQQLRYVSQEPLVEYNNYETFMGFVSQDGKADFDRVEKRTREPVRLRAEAFNEELAETWPKHFDALCDFASRAYRRPLAEQEKQQFAALYEKLRAKDLSYDEAFRAVLAGVLVSPEFLYRSEQPEAGGEARPVSNWELASRLSYFLWASMPDDQLRESAAAGSLVEPAVLAAEVQRMLKDSKARGLATEFATQWLQVRDIRENREKNEKLFPEFDEKLRGALYDETVWFFQDLFQSDRSLLEIVDADYALLNEELARYYGIPGVTGPEWRRVEGVKKYGRGGVLALASVLARQSAASRTSPVLRGNWLVDTLLGEKTPKPPANVPRLPDEANESGELTVRQLVEQHAHVAECTVCHQRIDPFGFALEKYDAIGRLRDKDAAGRQIATDARLKDGTQLDGLDSLRQYLLTQRKDQVLRQFCKKLLGYALGRSVVLSDEPLLDEMLAELKRSDYRSSTAVLAIVRSPQFLNHRGLEATKEQ